MQGSILAFSGGRDFLGVLLFRYFSLVSAVACFLTQHSVALSIKMSILLYLPAVGLVLVYRGGLIRSAGYLLAAAFLQALIAWEFLLAHPQAYLLRSFDFSRAFLYKWTVNWKFLDEDAFLSKRMSVGLLVGHLTVLSLFAATKWCRSEGGPLMLPSLLF